MVLPLLFSFLAPQLLGGTALEATLGTAGLSALGAGVGGAVETGDLEKGILTGLGSFAGGQLLGGLGGGADAATVTPSANLGEFAPTTSPAPMAKPDWIANAPIGTTPTAPAMGIKDLMGGFKNFALSPEGIGSTVGSMAGSALGDQLFSKSDAKPKSTYKEMQPIPRMAVMPGADYQPGGSGEWNYGISTPQSAEALRRYNGISGYADGGMIQRMANPSLPGMGPVRLAGGGIVALAEGGDVPQQANEREIISAAVAAVQGKSPQPEIALATFVRKFGESALRQLVDAVQSGKMQNTADRFANGEKGKVQGPGDGSGVDDMVPAKMDNGTGDVLLSDGEYVLRKDAADSLEQKFGGGFLDKVNKSGANAGNTAQKHMASA